MATKFYLPSKISSYLRRLDIEYTRIGNALFREIIAAARISVQEETAYDNWNGGTYGHDVTFFLPPETIAKTPFDKEQEMTSELLSALNACAKAVSNEFFNALTFELADEADPLFQAAFSVSDRPLVNPDTLAIWQPGTIRLFISHRDEHKVSAKRLAEALEGYGISAFVAHDTIEPLESWQHEIIKGLETMEIMLTFVTDDFHDSVWTNQEVGFALGRNIPVISLKLQKRDPGGFVGSTQALRGSIDDVEASAPGVYGLIASKLHKRERLQPALIKAFINSPSWSDTTTLFDRMESVVTELSNAEVEEIIAGYAKNDQLYNAIYLDNRYKRLSRFLERCTGRSFKIEGKQIKDVNPEPDDAIPF